MATILCVDDEPAVGLILADALERAGHQAVGARNVPEALQVLARGDVDLIISDYLMPGLTGLEFLALIQREGHDVPLIMLTGQATIEHAVASIKAGAVDYITKPLRPEQLVLAVEQALELRRLRRENEALRHEVMTFRSERQIVGDSAAVRRVLQTVAMAAPTRATVLLQGESGTGKELFARAIHDRSDRRDRPFVKVDCAALPEGLVESALFGRERGGARRPRPTSSGRAPSSGHTGGRCCSTRSRRCGSTSRRSCCACSRSRSSCASEGRRRCASTCASSPRPTATSLPRPPRGRSGRTCTTASA
jgi:DNA-binding NtrC family response regulator